MLGFWSLLIGIIFALISAIILKKVRTFSTDHIAESVLLLCIGYISYITSEMTENSGIITLLTCGIVMSHYSWYNLSTIGRHASFQIFEFLGYFAEAFVFIYLGITFFSYKSLAWSWDLFVAEVLIIFFGRFIGVVGLMAIIKTCCKPKDEEEAEAVLTYK